MKGFKPYSLLLFGIALLAGGALYAEFQSGYYAPQRLGSIDQSLLQKQSTDSQYSVDSFQLYRPELASGDGRQDVEAYCNTCHSTRYITMQPPLPAATWEAEVNKMAKSFGMSIPEDSAASIIKYLQTHYTRETRKR